jgi:hypothetical protein
MLLDEGVNCSENSLLLEVILHDEVVIISEFYFLNVLLVLYKHCYLIIIDIFRVERQGGHVIQAEIFDKGFIDEV